MSNRFESRLELAELIDRPAPAVLLCLVLWFLRHLAWLPLLLASAFCLLTKLVHGELVLLTPASFEPALLLLWLFVLAPALHEFAHIANAVLYCGESSVESIVFGMRRGITLVSRRGLTMPPFHYLVFLAAGAAFPAFLLLLLWLVVPSWRRTDPLFLLALALPMANLLPMLQSDGAQIRRLVKNHELSWLIVLGAFLLSVVNVCFYLLPRPWTRGFVPPSPAAQTRARQEKRL